MTCSLKSSSVLDSLMKTLNGGNKKEIKSKIQCINSDSGAIKELRRNINGSENPDMIIDMIRIEAPGLSL